MKKPILPILTILLTACQSIPPYDDTQTADVTFLCDGITETYSRATLTEAGVTDLWLWEGTTLLKHQQRTDLDFGSPTVSLTYGSHDLTFVASRADGQSLDDGVWSCSKVKDTFATTKTTNVTATSGNKHSVELSRRSAQVCFVIEDAIPAAAKTIHITADSHLSLAADLTASNPIIYDATVDVSSRAGNTGFSPSVSILTASHTDEEDVAVMIEFLAANNAVLYHYERTVPVSPNRCTNLKGSYFSGNSSITVNTAWLTDKDVDLFTE